MKIKKAMSILEKLDPEGTLWVTDWNERYAADQPMNYIDTKCLDGSGKVYLEPEKFRP